MPAFRSILIIAASLALAGCVTAANDTADLAALRPIAQVDERFQSYNIEMVEVTGGRFWAPYGGPAGEQFRQRAPLDLANPRLRQLAAALGPAYIRVSGSWANTTYLPAEGELHETPPPGFRQVLTRAQWRGLVDFARAVDAPIVTSFAAGEGARDALGGWSPVQAQRLLDLTREAGGTLYAAEMLNEPGLIAQGGLPAGYSSEAFARDHAMFTAWARSQAPGMILLGPGNLGEETISPRMRAMLLPPGGELSTADLLARTGASLDAVSWHFYGGSSPRCGGGTGADGREAALGDAWLDLTLREYDAVAGLRDLHAPGKPLWLTETAQAACGGSPWAASFADSFRYLNQLGLLAQRGVRAVMHNTLAASDYGLIDGDTLEPRANYWAAVLWGRLMGPQVLAPPPAPAGLRIYAHCLRGVDGGVALLAINPGGTVLALPVTQAGEGWVMQAADLDAGPITVNGRRPVLAANGLLAGMDGAALAGSFAIPPQAIAFAALPQAGNPACRG